MEAETHKGFKPAADLTERVPTGVPGLDIVLSGGLLKSGVYVADGDPGTGKTILGNQICFNHVATGGKDVALWTIKKFTAKGHNAHVPIFNLNFTDVVLEYPFRHFN